MHCGSDDSSSRDAARIFKTMAQVFLAFTPTSRSADAEMSSSISGDPGLKCRLSFSPDRAGDARQEPMVTRKTWPLQSVPDDSTSDQTQEQLLSPPNRSAFLKARSGSDTAGVSHKCALHSNLPSFNIFVDKENARAHPSTFTAELHPDPGMSSQNVPDDPTSEQTQEQPLSPLHQNSMTRGSESAGVSHKCVSHSNPQSLKSSEGKENVLVQASTVTAGDTQVVTPAQVCPEDSTVPACKQHGNTGGVDDEVARRAREQGCVDITFPGTVTQYGCCRFVSEILKLILFQRQQLPMTYDQLVLSQKKQLQTSVLDTEAVRRRPMQSADPSRRKCQQTLQDLEGLLQQLEVLFSLSRVPRVLLLMGGSLVLPKELYEVNLEGLVLAGGDQSLREPSCLRQLFRTLFVADVLSDARPVRLMATTILVLAHRDCGVDWFRPKLQFKVPTRVQKQMIALSSDPSSCKELRAEETDWQDYVWFQAPTTIKGFSN